MTKEQLAALRESIYDDTANDQNFALKILNRQLMLKYGKEYGLRIDSRAGEGTTVVISLPVPSPGEKVR
jgi:two-component system sensor histidine kinase YesM